jgi:hypothetical protein
MVLIRAAHGQPLAAGVIEAQDAADLRPDRGRVGVASQRAVDRAVVALGQVDGGLAVQVVGDEGQPHLAGLRLGPAGVGAEAEGRGRSQRERCVGCDRECRHRASTSG